MCVLTATTDQGKTTGINTLKFGFLILVGWWVLGFGFFWLVGWLVLFCCFGLVFPKQKVFRSVMKKCLIKQQWHMY